MVEGEKREESEREREREFAYIELELNDHHLVALIESYIQQFTVDHLVHNR